VENFLKQCVDSIIRQDYKDYEIILVDDGSTDGSGRICDEYSEKYKFVFTIHQENGGSADARNTGMKIAEGQYMLFVDSDDYIGESALTAIGVAIQENPDADVIFLEAVKFHENGRMIPMGNGYAKGMIKGKSHGEVLAHIASLPKFPGSACEKLVKRELILKHELFFHKELVTEDIEWVLGLLIAAGKYDYCDANYYYYRQDRKGSKTSDIGVKNVDSLIFIIKKWTQKDISPQAEQYRKYVYSFLAYEYMIAVMWYAGLSLKEKSAVKNALKEYSWLLSFNNTRKVRLVRNAYKLMGLNLTSKALRSFLKLRARRESGMSV